MKWSFSIGRVAGIDLRVHATFFIIVIWGALAWAAAGAAGMAFGAALMLLLFACVVLHELGHSLVAQRYGIPVRRIVLLPIGGVAELGRSSMTPRQELFVALAGPAVNVVIALVLLGILAGMGAAGFRPETVLMQERAQISAGFALLYLLNTNILLVLFNMIPAFPLDGGRVLRALLGMKFGEPRATRLAASVGQIVAILMGVWGLLSGNLWLALIAVFIFLGAGAETAYGESRRVLATRRVGEAYNQHAIALTIDDRVSRVVDYLLTSYQPDFAVVQRGQLAGVVTRDDVLKYLAGNSYDVYVTEVMQENVLKVQAGMSLEEVREKMGEAQARLAAVYEGERYLGLVSAEDIAEAFAILAFAERSAKPRAEEGPQPQPRWVAQ